MKKQHLLFCAIALLSTACKFVGRHTVIVEKDPGHYLKVEYRGNVTFNPDQTRIDRISPYGYLKYELNGNRLLAETDDNGQIVYEINDHGRQKQLSGHDKQFLAMAIKDMVRLGHSSDGR